MYQSNQWFIGHLLRVPVFIDLGAAITVLWIAMAFEGDLRGMLLVIVAFLSTVVLHELGHALTAQARGMVGIRIVISALGGYCSFAGTERPSSRLMITLAGPATNFLLVAVLYALFANLAAGLVADGVATRMTGLQALGLALARRLPEVGNFAGLLYELAAFGWWINLFLGILNSMPVYPLDGGQAVYRVLQLFIGERQARTGTLVMSVIGAVVCIGLFSALLGRPDTFIIILMLFLLYQAWRTLA